VTDAAHAVAQMTVSIAQFGSTRSINAGVAAGIAMHTWVRQHADLSRAW
jgi:tRNA G18 (ribose-2'-O)-methylase SpoU